MDIPATTESNTPGYRTAVYWPVHRGNNVIPASSSRPLVNAARRSDCYQRIADTIVQLSSLHASGVIASPQAIQSAMRSKKTFRKEFTVTPLAPGEESTIAHLEKVLYTARAHTTGGRDGGASRTDDGRLDVKLSRPGTSGTGTNPEQLLAAGWSACFLSAIRLVAGKKQVTLPNDLAIDAEVDLGTTHGIHGLAARLTIRLPGMERLAAVALVEAADQACPFSRATRGNIDVAINVV